MTTGQELAAQLHAAGLAVFPCRADKAPAVQQGESWKDWSTRDPSTLYWPTGIVGLPVPDGVAIIDLDTYKGMTREKAEAALGAPLDWGRAMIQTTQQGGQHYAFRSAWPVRQTTDLCQNTIGRGLDTRSGEKGYIASGHGYTWNGFGPFALVHPDTLPELPDACRAVLEHLPAPPREPRPAAPENLETDEAAIREALGHIDPGCTRQTWVKVGLALRSHHQDDPDQTGLDLFEAWSAGEFWPDGAPDNYLVDGPGSPSGQWSSFKPEGDTTIGSLFYEAIQSGWVPPPSFDASRAFGAGAASSVEFAAILEGINAHGADPAHTLDLVEQVRTLACAPLQRSALLAALTRELKDAGLLTKALRVQLDEVAGAPRAPRSPGMYGNNHTENALQFLETYYPEGVLVRSDEVYYRYTGKVWEVFPDASLRHQVASVLAPSFPLHSTVTGTVAMIGELTHAPDRKIGDTPASLVLFQNGVLDIHSGQLLPHSPFYFTTNILPYNYDAAAACPRWLRFLGEVFEGDEERIALLQEWFGYLLSGSYEHQKMMLLLGPSRSGKGTIGRMIHQVVGDYNYSGGSLRAFTTDPYIESIRTRTTVFLGDAEATIPRNLAGAVIERLKTISGGDTITYGRKYKSTLSEVIPSRITIASNSVPKLFDDSGALAGRLLVIPFNVSWFDRENVNLFDELIRDLEGVALWALQGMARLHQHGKFTLPAASRAEMRYIVESYSPLEQFLADACDLSDETAVVFSKELFEAYRAWAVRMGEGHIMSGRQFTNAFKDVTRARRVTLGLYRRGEERGRGFRGVKLLDEAPVTSSAFQPKVVQ